MRETRFVARCRTNTGARIVWLCLGHRCSFVWFLYLGVISLEVDLSWRNSDANHVSRLVKDYYTSLHPLSAQNPIVDVSFSFPKRVNHT